jgi:hypothetical protein
MPKSQITIRNANPANERSTVLGLLKNNLPEAAASGRFDWAYLDNPDGAALVWLAETTEGEAVGTSAAFPRKFRVNGNTVRALVLSDFAIDRRFRTLGPAVALLRATLAPIDDGSFEFALDHPSESMLAVYKRLGGTELARLRRYVRLMKVSGAAERRWGEGFRASIMGSVGDFMVRTADRFRGAPRGMTVDVHLGRFNDEFGRLNRVLSERRPVYGERQPIYLDWRYRSGIRFNYTTVTVRSAGKLLAYAVLQQSDGMSMTIAEFVCPEDATIEAALFRALLDISRRCKAESLQASCLEGGAWCTVLNRLGFTAREQSAGPVVYSPNGSKWNELLTDKDQWWMTDGDRDG